MTSNTQLRDAAGEADLTFEDPQGPGKRQVPALPKPPLLILDRALLF